MATIEVKEEAKGSMKEQAIQDLSTQIEYLKSLSWRHRGDNSGGSVAEWEIRPLEYTCSICGAAGHTPTGCDLCPYGLHVIPDLKGKMVAEKVHVKKENSSN